MNQETEITTCNHCGTIIEDADDNQELCEECQEGLKLGTWLIETTDVVEALIEDCGWGLDNINYANSRSRYFEISRSQEDENGDEIWQNLKIRISDHDNLYDCDISLSYSGNEADLSMLKAKLTREFQED